MLHLSRRQIALATTDIQAIGMTRRAVTVVYGLIRSSYNPFKRQLSWSLKATPKLPVLLQVDYRNHKREILVSINVVSLLLWYF